MPPAGKFSGISETVQKNIIPVPANSANIRKKLNPKLVHGAG
jgi:hypothetical protein